MNMKASIIFATFAIFIVNAQFHDPYWDFQPAFGRRSAHTHRRGRRSLHQPTYADRYWENQYKHLLERQRQEETQRRREHNLWQEKARMAEMEAQKLRRAEWESKQRKAQIAVQKRLEAEKAEAEEKRQEMLKMAQCEIWENKFTDVLSDLQPLKLKHQTHRRNDHFDLYKVMVSLPSEISASDLDVSVQGPRLTITAERPIAEELKKPAFCEPSEELQNLFREKNVWKREFPQFNSPIDADSVSAEIVFGHKLQVEFTNPPEHEIFKIPVKTDMAEEKRVSMGKMITRI
jgi:hypothetical protein